ncbi:MAG: hypothetical protein NTV34_03390, partial [Proteobacteria bacterium]|nr:hypothetical protein [Pseudomonadota bacterium]
MVHPIDQLFATNPFLHDDANKGLFISSFRACAKIHYEKSDLFRGLWQESHLKPEDIQTEQDLAKVPFLMVNLFKEHELITGDPHAIVLNLTSSGTTGQKSQIFLNQESLDRVKSLAWQIHSYLGMTSNEEVNYLCFTYDPTVATHLGTAFTDELLTSFTGKKNVYYAIQWNQSMQNFELNVQGVLDCLNRYLEFPN